MVDRLMSASVSKLNKLIGISANIIISSTTPSAERTQKGASGWPRP
jgi:hypothetical protein